MEITPGFTFQYVSINTKFKFHVLLIFGAALHSNMFLLIRLLRKYLATKRIDFTFQYVSINTVDRITSYFKELPLHSNMFLLILFVLVAYRLDLIIFTFQYVSINTYQTIRKSLYLFLSLHSNMFLLIL